MTIGDAVVILELVEEEAMASPPVHGIVNAEGAGNADVLWRNGVLNTIPTIRLLKVFLGDETKVGKWEQIYGLPSIDTEDDPTLGGGPKSPAAAGVVIDVFGTAAYGSAGPPDNQWVVLSTEDGRGSFLLVVQDPPDAELPDPFFEQPGRRNV